MTMARNQNRRRRPMAQINVVPYIDVMLVLLIIFMVTAPLLKQGVHIDLPRAPSKPLPAAQHQQQPLIVNVDKQGSFYLNRGNNPQRSLSDDALAKHVNGILSHQPGISVYVRGDAGVNYGRVITAMVILQNAGASDIGLITQPSGSQDDKPKP